MTKRGCGTCTKCCEGWLAGDALGHSFYPGKPCHFIAIGKGCTVYAKRPKDPCVSYQCAWIQNEDIPEWFKPDAINAIVDFRKIGEIPYFKLTEAGEVLSSKVLSWAINYAIANQLNFCWDINKGPNYFGSPEFVKAMQNDGVNQDSSGKSS